MKVKNLAILAAVGGFALAGSAQANIIAHTAGSQLEVTEVDMSGGYVLADGSILAGTAANGALFGAAGVTVYRVWAHVDSAMGTVAGAGGSVVQGLDLVMNSSNGAFVNDVVFGGDGAPNGAFMPLPGFQSLLWESYVTVGGATSGDTPGGFSISDGSGILGGLAGNVIGQNVGWFITPSAGAGVVSDGAGGWRVLLAQLVVASGETVSGNMRVFGGGDDVYYNFLVPAPGALALLGLAGLAGTRRRRA